MIISSAATFHKEFGQFAEICWTSQENYAARLGHQFQKHIVSRSAGNFEHRLSTMLEHDDEILCYLEWDVLVADDAPNLFELLGDADVLLAPFEDVHRARGLNELCPALKISWHMIPIMVIRREALAKIAAVQPHCHVYATRMPTEAAHYECTVLMAIQRAGLKLATLPKGMHVLRHAGDKAPFLHFEGHRSKLALTHESRRQSS